MSLGAYQDGSHEQDDSTSNLYDRTNNAYFDGPKDDAPVLILQG